MLTQKQKNFCYNIVSGLNGIESYMQAYNSKNKNVANVESTKLLKREDITSYINELNKPIINHSQNVSISQRKKRIQEIEKRIEICKQKEDENSLIRYYDMLNKIDNLYKDNETEQKTDNILDNVDISTLKAITSA